MKNITIWTAVSILVLGTLAFAGVPQTINYQGYLKDGTGSPISTATSITFKLYSSTSGVNPLWNSGAISVTPVSGVYSLELGKTPQPTLPSFDRQYWLGIKAGADTEMRPLQPLTSVPYALRAVSAENSTAANSLSGAALTQLDSRYVDPTLPPRASTQQIVQQQWNQVAPTQAQFTNGSNPTALAFDGTNIWVAFAGNGIVPGTVQRINPGNMALVGSPISVGINPKALLYDGTSIWVANKGSNTVTKINATTGSVIGSYSPFAAGPQALAYDGTYLWVANGTGNNVSRLIPSSGALFEFPIAVDKNPSALAYDGTYIWAANKTDNTVTRITATTGIAELTFNVGTGPTALALDVGNTLHVLNSGNNTLHRCNPNGCTNAGVVPSNSTTMIYDGKNLWVGGQNDISKYDTNAQIIGQISSSTFYTSALLYDGRNLWSANNGYGIINKWENAGASVGIASVGNQQLQDGSVTSSKISGTLNDSSLSSNVALLNSDQIFTGTKTFTTAPTFISGTGMPPFEVISNGMVPNLNADYLDGQHASYFATATHSHANTPTIAVFDTIPLATMHFTDGSFVLEGLNGNTINLRAYTTDYMYWSIVYPTGCNSVAGIGSSTMNSVFRFSSVVGTSLPATFCNDPMGSMMLINVFVFGKGQKRFTCWQQSNNANMCWLMD